MLTIVNVIIIFIVIKMNESNCDQLTLQFADCVLVLYVSLLITTINYVKFNCS